MQLSELVQELKAIPPTELAARGVIQPARKKANGEITGICPNCDNGTSKTGDGVAFTMKDGAWLAKCFKCGKGFDNFILIALHYGLDPRADFVEVCRRAAADFGFTLDEVKPKKFSAYHNLTPFTFERPRAVQFGAIKEVDAADAQVEELTAEYIRRALFLTKDNLEMIPAEDRRAASVESLRYFHCVYTENWIHPKTFAEYKLGLRDKLPPRSRRILIPTFGRQHYVAVLLDSDRTKENKSRWKMHAGLKVLPFGIETLTAANCPPMEPPQIKLNFTDKELKKPENPNDPFAFVKKAASLFETNFVEPLIETAPTPTCTTDKVLIVEGEFDAISIWQAFKERGYNDRAVIATGGITARQWLDAFDRRCKELNICPLIVICFDAGEKEKVNAENCAKELRLRGYPVKVADFKPVVDNRKKPT